MPGCVSAIRSTRSGRCIESQARKKTTTVSVARKASTVPAFESTLVRALAIALGLNALCSWCSASSCEMPKPSSHAITLR